MKKLSAVLLAWTAALVLGVTAAARTRIYVSAVIIGARTVTGLTAAPTAESARIAVSVKK
jgi:hypothetical protein